MSVFLNITLESLEYKFYILSKTNRTSYNDRFASAGQTSDFVVFHTTFFCFLFHHFKSVYRHIQSHEEHLEV